MSKRFLIIIGVLILAFIGIVVFSKQDQPEQGQIINGGSSHIYGNENASVKLVEFGDFECPACQSYYPIIQQLKDDYGEQIAIQFRHYPLVNRHPNAMAAHRAAEAAGNQGKFWEMHDLLYARQNNWSSATNPAQIFEDYAAELTLNIDQFKADVSKAETADIINQDVKAAQDIGATGTPTFVINGVRIEQTPTTYEEFTKLIDEKLAETNQ